MSVWQIDVAYERRYLIEDDDKESAVRRARELDAADEGGEFVRGPLGQALSISRHGEAE